MKKIVALVLCLVMVVGLMAGCEKAMDLKTLTQKMDEATKNQTSMSAKMAMDLEMSLGVTGVTMNVAMGMDMEAKTDMATGNMYMDMDVDAEMLGETQEISMEVYADTEDGTTTVYTYDSSTDTWVKQVLEGYMEQVQELQGVTITMSEIPEEKMSLAKEKETVNGRECYVLTADLDGTYFDDAMKAVMEQAMETEAELDEETKALLESFDWSKLNSKMVYHVDAETFVPVQVSAELLGLGDVMSGMFATVMAQLGGLEGMEDVEIKIDVPVCKMAMTDVVYGDVEVPAVPQEAIDNAVDADTLAEEAIVGAENALVQNQPQADGSYLLTCGTDTVRVVVPEGYPYVEATADYLSAMDENYMGYLEYVLLTGADMESMEAAFLTEVNWAKENDYYKSHSEMTELNGFGTMGLIYNDDTSLWYVGKQLDSCVLLICAEVAGETYDLESLLSGVEIVAE